MATITRGTATAVPANNPGDRAPEEPAGGREGKPPRKGRRIDWKGATRERTVRCRFRIAGDGGRRNPTGRDSEEGLPGARTAGDDVALLAAVRRGTSEGSARRGSMPARSGVVAAP